MYNKVIEIDTIEEIKYILARVTSCYRLNNESEKAIELYLNMYNKYGRKIQSVELLTSIAAAYCDLNKKVEAKKYADMTYAMLNGKATDELLLIYARIKKDNI